VFDLLMNADCTAFLTEGGFKQIVFSGRVQPFIRDGFHFVSAAACKVFPVSRVLLKL